MAHDSEWKGGNSHNVTESVLNELCRGSVDANSDSSLPDRSDSVNDLRSLTQLGAQLFTQGCSGVRVVLPATVADVQSLGGYAFPGFGSHSSKSRFAYLNAAAAIGQTAEELDVFLSKLDKVFAQFRKSQSSRKMVENPAN
ncbi:unnamed protein product [Echinostoma caproni]|uniref:Selenocysteine synthase n=1 Tax=Echinostoma caproni TaxID=27848 RepID=A0A183AV23_9TREM|nr:unnamed protein product [Echinostoma caproni]